MRRMNFIFKDDTKDSTTSSSTESGEKDKKPTRPIGSGTNGPTNGGKGKP